MFLWHHMCYAEFSMDPFRKQGFYGPALVQIYLGKISTTYVSYKHLLHANLYFYVLSVCTQWEEVFSLFGSHRNEMSNLRQNSNGTRYFFERPKRCHRNTLADHFIYFRCDADNVHHHFVDALWFRCSSFVQIEWRQLEHRRCSKCTNWNHTKSLKFDQIDLIDERNTMTGWMVFI